MKWLIYFSIILCICIPIPFFFFPIFTLKNTQWSRDSPEIIEITSSKLRTCFSVTEPATIYWRIYSDQTLHPSPGDLTNINTIDAAVSFGGNNIDNTDRSYTNSVSNLEPNTSYKLHTIAVSYIGTFPKNITTIEFTTKK